MFSNSNEVMASDAEPHIALAGEWFHPRPITFVVNEEEPGTLISDDGVVKLEIKKEKEDGKMKRRVNLTDTSDGFTMTGYANIRYSRVHWANGSIWARKIDHIAPTNAPATFTNEAQHKAAEDDVVEDGAAPIPCCSFLFGGSSVPVAGGADAGPPEPEKFGRVMPIEIISARGLRRADWGSDNDTYVRCELIERPGTLSFKTEVVKSQDPIWNHTGQLEDYQVGDGIIFSIYDKDSLSAEDKLGQVIVPSEKFHPDGFEGELQIEGQGAGTEAFLTIDIAPESELLGRKRMLSPVQIENIVSRVNDVVDIALLGEESEASIIRTVVGTINRRLRKALLSFCHLGWVNALSVLLDEAKDQEQKVWQVQQCLRDCFRNPLAEALTQAIFRSSSMALKLNKLVVNQIVEEMVESIVDGLSEVGLAVSVDDENAQNA